MLKGFLTLLIFQFLGECITRVFSLLIPGSVIGMVLLLIFLMIRGRSFEGLDSVVSVHLKYLPLLFIPAAMGVITQLDLISKDLLAIFFSLVIGTVVSLMFSAKLMDFLISKKAKK